MPSFLGNLPGEVPWPNGFFRWPCVAILPPLDFGINLPFCLRKLGVADLNRFQNSLQQAKLKHRPSIFQCEASSLPLRPFSEMARQCPKDTSRSIGVLLCNSGCGLPLWWGVLEMKKRFPFSQVFGSKHYRKSVKSWGCTQKMTFWTINLRWFPGTRVVRSKLRWLITGCQTATSRKKGLIRPFLRTMFQWWSIFIFLIKPVFLGAAWSSWDSGDFLGEWHWLSTTITLHLVRCRYTPKCASVVDDACCGRIIDDRWWIFWFLR